MDSSSDETAEASQANYQDPAQRRFRDLLGWAEGLGFPVERIEGSHRILTHPDIPELLNLQEVKGEVLKAKEAWIKAGRAARKPIPPVIPPRHLPGRVGHGAAPPGGCVERQYSWYCASKTMTVAACEYLLADLLGPASALGTLLTLAVLASMLLANKLLGRTLGSLFRMV